MNKTLILLAFLFFLLPLAAQEADSTFMYRLELSDKGNSSYTLDNPIQYLSTKAIERRQKQGIAIDSSDFPIAQEYLYSLQSVGTRIVAKSKWLNTVTVATHQREKKEALLALPFVKNGQLVYQGILPESTMEEAPEQSIPVSTDQASTDPYGKGYKQITMLNGHLLQALGYLGKDIHIAVFDGGFHNADKLDILAIDQVAGVYNFTHSTDNPFRLSAQHGTRVLSCMLANKPHVLVGTAPKATYHLFCTEVDSYELPVEEDYWVTAVEYADSLGVDILTTSLGYTLFEGLTEMNHHTSELDGETIYMSKGASEAAQKGMLVLNAAGNEGSNPAWRTLSAPSDAKGVLSVGAVTADKQLASFSPVGPSADQRVKPDVVAMGVSTALVASNGAIIEANGTSYSTPVVAGLAACLWEALPHLSASALLALLQETADRYLEPDTAYGYGIPDFFKAYNQVHSSIDKQEPEAYTGIRKIGNYLVIDHPALDKDKHKLSIVDCLGGKVEVVTQVENTGSYKLSHLAKGLYVAFIEGRELNETYKFIIR